MNEDVDENKLMDTKEKELNVENILTLDRAVTSKSTMQDCKLKEKDIVKEKKKLTINERINRKKK